MSILMVSSQGSINDAPLWATPPYMAVKRIGPTSSIPDQPNLYPNVDCAQIGYRLSDSNLMELGCFSRVSYGLEAPDSNMIIFNGGSEAQPIVPLFPQQLLLPWPGSSAVLSLSSALNDGFYIGLYKNIYGALQDQKGSLGQITGKKITSAPDYTFRNPDGSSLVVNPQTISFSTNGSWMVVETVGGAFVRYNLTSLDGLAFAPAFSTISGSTLFDSEVAISDDGHFAVIANRVSDSFRVYDLSTCQQSSLKYQACSSYDYKPYIKTRVSGINLIRHVRFVNNGLISFSVNTSIGNDTYLLAPSQDITSLIDYLALGDSYTSGEGAFDYMSGTDGAGNHCHLSLHSYPLLITQQLFGNSGGHSVACSGAKTRDLLPGDGENYRGQASRTTYSESSLISNFRPGYLAQSKFVNYYQPKVLSASIGGNDIGFGDILQTCVLPKITRHFSDNVCFNTYEDRLELKNLIDRQAATWVSTFKQLSAMSPLSQIYIIGYPQIAYDKGSCALNVHLNKSELEFSNEVTAYLNGALRSSASQAGVNYVDISEALYGYRLCENASYNLAVNGLTTGNDGGPFGLKIFGNESYHPNAFGHLLIESAILKQTNNLKMGGSKPVVENISQTLLNMPKSGRPVNTVAVAQNAGAQVIFSNVSATLQIDGQSTGLKPNYDFTIKLDNSVVLASVKSDSNGSIDSSYSLPPNTISGAHTVEITGFNQSGETILLSFPVEVAYSVDDVDGDGVANSVDSCPNVTNSGIDSDKDGIDDACDGYIGPTPPGTSGNVLSISGSIASTPTFSSGSSVTSKLSNSSSPNTTSDTSFGTISNSPVNEARRFPNQAIPNLLPNTKKIIKPGAVQSKLSLKRWTITTAELSLIILVLLALALLIKHVYDNRHRLSLFNRRNLIWSRE